MEYVIAREHPNVESLRKVVLSNTKDPHLIASTERHLKECHGCAQMVGSIREGDFGDIWTPD